MMKRLLDLLRRFWRLPDDFSEHPDYEAARDFKLDFTPEADFDYEWVHEYAGEVYQRLSNTLEQLDSKADSIIKYLGGGSGLLTLGVIMNRTNIGLYVLASLFVPLLLALFAIWFAGIARLPANSPLPPTIYWAIQYAETYGDKAHDTFLAQWNLACEGLRIALNIKATFVSRAGRFFLGTMVSLGVPFVMTIIEAYLGR